MKKGLSVLLAGVMATSLFGCSSNEPKEQVKLTIAAAASLENAFEDELIPMFEKEYPNVTIEGVYDSSGKLQLQIEKGLDADVFFSAATTQMNALKDEDLVDADSISNVLENKLVLIKGKDSTTTVTGFDNIKDASIIAIGDPEVVPAGSYAKEALTNLGVWDSIQDRLSLAGNVTEVLSQVETQNAEIGLVYATDAAVEKHVPVYTVDKQHVHVVVGETKHPMLEEHFIEWITLNTNQGIYRKQLNPGQEPVADFCLCDGEQVEEVYAYCNLHGLWKC